MIAGGSSEYCATAMSPASSTSLYVDVTPGANHSVVQEQMAFPRVVSAPHNLFHDTHEHCYDLFSW